MQHHDRTDAVHKGIQGHGSAELRHLARRMAVARRSLAEALPVELLHDPALDILLALYQADDPIAADNLAFYTTVSASVAGRWLAALQSRNLVDVVEGRVVLSATGTDRMVATLSTVMERQRDL